MRLFAVSGPSGHPVHPFLVPLPIGAFVSSLIFDILTWTRPGDLPSPTKDRLWARRCGPFARQLGGAGA